VVGGGFIGLEIAASAVKNGCNVTVIEFSERLLGRVFPEPVALDITTLHEYHGVEIILNDSVASFSGDDAVRIVKLESGKEYPADVVIVGIGITPRTGLAASAGLETNDGITTNQFCQTDDSNIFAIGDCARGFNLRYRQWIRLESWQNAEQQAAVVAGNICGYETPWESVPWFWSDQYHYNIQMAGDFQNCDKLLTRGELGRGKVMYFAFENGCINGAVAIGEGTSAARDLRVSQKLIEQKITILPEDLEDSAIKLKNLLPPGGNS